MSNVARESYDLATARAEAQRLITRSKGKSDVRAPHSDALADALDEQAVRTVRDRHGLTFYGPAGADAGPQYSARLPVWSVTLVTEAQS